MPIDFLKRALLFAVLCLVQALVLNRIHLFDCATPLLYVLFVLFFERNYPKWAVLLWSFALGIVLDMFSNTPGVTAASLTLLGVVQPYFLGLFIQRDAPDDIRPSMQTIGVPKFVVYVMAMVLLYCTVFFTLETFSFFNWLQWVKSVGGSALITVVLILTFESVRKR